MGFPVEGSFAALERTALFPSGETARTLAIMPGANRLTVFALASRTTNPTAVPMKARAPVRSNTIEFGVPGRGMAAPTTGGDLLISIGTSGIVVLIGGGNELAA